MVMANQPMIPTDASNSFTSFLLLVFLIFPVFIILNRNSKPPIPPGPYQWPIIGNILQLGNKPHIRLAQFAETYGPIFSLKLGTQLVVVGTSKAVAVEILKKHDKDLSGRHVPHMAPIKNPEVNDFSIGWVLECNEKWKNSRSLCKNELFSCKALDSSMSIREKKVMEVVGFIKKMESNSRMVRIREVVNATVFNMLSNVLVSKDLASLENECADGEISQILNDIAELAAAPNVSDFYPVLSRFDLQGLRKKAIGLHVKCVKLLEDIVNERRKEKMGHVVDSRRSDFLDTLIKQGSSNDQINFLLLELLSAGTDTSSTTIEWAVAELIKNPNCMKKARNEIAMMVKQDVLKESHIDKLPYIQACIKETLRLHSPGPFLLPHRAINTCRVMNYTIPKNSQVLVNFWAIGRDPDIWEQPLAFNPERFIGSDLDFKGNDFEFIPFGSGRRICPGLPMAAKQVALIVASLIHFFDWYLPEGRKGVDLDMSEKYGLTLRMERPLLLVPRSKRFE